MKNLSRSIPPFAAWIARRAAMLGLAGALVLTTGCFGLFPLTKSIYKTNKEASENEFWQSVIFWFMSPAYVVVMVGDVLVLNPVEFWTGKTIDLGVSQNSIPEVPYEVSKQTGELLGFGAETRLVMRPVRGGFEIRDEQTGRLAGTIHPSASGGAALHSADGSLVREFPRVS